MPGTKKVTCFKSGVRSAVGDGSAGSVEEVQPVVSNAVQAIHVARFVMAELLPCDVTDDTKTD